MNKYVLMLAAAGLIAAAPAYYAFQAQAEEAAVEATAPVADGDVASIDCAAIPEGTQAPAECADMAVKAAPVAAEKAHEGHEGY